jgi:hypothetical protein
MVATYLEYPRDSADIGHDERIGEEIAVMHGHTPKKLLSLIIVMTGGVGGFIYC